MKLWLFLITIEFIPMNLWALEGELKKLGQPRSSLTEEAQLSEGDLIHITKGQFSFKIKNTTISIGRDSLVAIGREEAFLEIYRGGVTAETNEKPFILLQGTSQLLIEPNSRVYWASKDSGSHISIHKGQGKLLTPTQGKELLAGQGVMIEGDQITSSIIALKQQKAQAILEPEYIEKLFETTPEFHVRYNALGLLEDLSFNDPKEVIYHYLDALKRAQWTTFLERGREHLLAQQLLLLEESEHILPKRLHSYFVQAPTITSLFKDFDRLDIGLQKMPQHDQVFVSFFVRQAMAEKLMAKKTLKESVSGFYRIETKHNSNVTETPEGSNAPSDQHGAMLFQLLRLKWTGLRHSWGKPSINLRASERSFFDSDFTSREVTTLTLIGKINKKLGKKGDTIHEVNPRFDLRADFVNSIEGRDLNFVTYSPQVEVVFAPTREWGAWSDLFFHFWTTGVEYRDYAPGFNFSVNGEERDVTTPFTSWLGISIKKWRDFRVQHSFALSLRSSTSDDPQLDYNHYSADLSMAFQKGGLELKPNFAFRYREQPNYRGSVRNDQKHELGIQFTSYNFGNWADLSGGYRYLSQTSTQETFFNYIDHQWNLSLTKAF